MTMFWAGVLISSIGIGFVAYLLNELKKAKVQEIQNKITNDEASIEKKIDSSSIDQLIDDNNKSSKP
jgi:hypothetical protein